ncbi:hypothetical protein Y032_0972g3257 [Ancylostoma ceylanicum]|uniref:Uncharacterized protein n=1 Tax=Ancylostoma ceylanicum TaxID=53326 RepID=A0A016W8A9_9BILA|nr:hypothetical protein Y032_0972g3257 [Ancylostoma ceylanicum]
MHLSEESKKKKLMTMTTMMPKDENIFERGVDDTNDQNRSYVGGEIVCSYTTSNFVAELQHREGLDMSLFVLALEVEVYKDDTTELELLMDNRLRTNDRVLSIQQSLFKHYNTPEHLREGTWRRAKESLNSRVRRLRETALDRRQLTQERLLHSGNARTATGSKPLITLMTNE